jgi:hypothetical protein
MRWAPIIYRKAPGRSTLWVEGHRGVGARPYRGSLPPRRGGLQRGKSFDERPVQGSPR